MKGHGDNGSTATRGLSSSSSPHISSSDKLLHDQELQHLVTSSIPSPPYSGLSLINASAALVFGADPIYYPLLYMSHIQQMEIGRSPLPSGKSQDLNLKASSPPVISNNNNNNNNVNKINKNSKNNKNNNNNNDNNNNKNKNKEVNGKSQGQTSPNQNGSRDKVFTCPTCNRCFGYKHVLQNHERTHTGEKPFECNICNKKFTRDHHLKTHMRLHTGEKPYQCTHCDRQFVQVANLRRHLRVHTGERPYACELCSSRFSDSNQLKAHMLIHKGEKPYECQECGSHFRRRHHLAHHKCMGEGDAEGGITAQRSKVIYPASSSSSSPDTSPPQLLTPASVTSGVAENPRSSTKRANGHGTSVGNSGGSADKRKRKCQETRRIIKLEPLNLSTSVGSPTPLTTFLPGAAVPEQDHPEDLSMNGSGLRGRHYSGSSSSVTASSSPSPRSGSDTSVYNF